jgi:glycosyltransferase involved in cell wall biosynthesis
VEKYVAYDPTLSPTKQQQEVAAISTGLHLRGVPLVYVLHCGDLFGTERMALETLDGLGSGNCVTISPKGPLLRESESRGHRAITAEGNVQLLRELIRLMRAHKELVFFSTTVVHAFLISFVNLFFRRRLSHLHPVHGGDDAYGSYGKKKWLNWINVKQVAVSEYVREQLIQNGVSSSSVVVVENFLNEHTKSLIRKKEIGSREFTCRGLVVGRLVVQKRIELLIDTLEQYRSDLSDFKFDVFGDGVLAHHLRSRARRANVPVHFHGYVADVSDHLADYDFLLHLNHEEPFGLVVLEAMAAGIPVLVPASGGAATIVRDHENGFTFRSESAKDLGFKLRQLKDSTPELRHSIVEKAQQGLRTRYSAQSQIAAYQAVIAESFR